MVTFFKKAVKKWLLGHDMLISRPPGQFFAEAYKLRRARDLGLKVEFAVDGGAARGNWVRMFKGVYPAASVLCVEPREDEQDNLSAVAREYEGVMVARSLLGAAEGQAALFVDGEQSSIMPNAQGQAFGTPASMAATTLDNLLTRRALPWPDYIKLDVQGAELVCLGGASRSLMHACAVQLEVSLLPFQKGQPCLAEVVAFMKERAFVSYDVLSSTVRPLDGAWGQADILFVKEESPLRADARWSGAMQH